jgi:exosortase
MQKEVMGSATSVKPRGISAELVAWTRLVIVTSLVIAVYAEILIDLAREWWTRPEASYGILIPPFAFYLAYLGREQTRALPKRPDLRGLGLVATACLILLCGKLASEFFLCRISFILMLTGLAWTFWGVRRLRSVAFSLGLLTTMVPIPAILYNAAAAPLQLFASKVATQLAQMFGITVFRDGNVIHLANISLGVAEACSGLHSLSALIVASLVLGFIENLSAFGKLLIFALSAPLAIMVNVFRVTGTAVLADAKPDLALGYYHAFSSWLVFLIGFGILWLATKLVFRFSGQAVS